MDSLFRINDKILNFKKSIFFCLGFISLTFLIQLPYALIIKDDTFREQSYIPEILVKLVAFVMMYLALFYIIRKFSIWSGTPLTMSIFKLDSSLRKTFTKYLLGFLILYLIFLILVYLKTITLTVTPVPTVLNWDKHPFINVLEILLIAIVQPFFEEALFRGILQEKLSKRFSSLLSIILVAVVFSFVHFYTFEINVQLISGLFFGFLYWKFRSIESTWIFHSIYNGVIFLMMIIFNT
ncbi:CPBP family intramembrane glutamic endopeptidase [Streptococcus pluranimalium]|uniref:CPBP family intramembrane glutamic endopeptidase n=1 Tax=Streptococcus pluranimalium TaxID=82348 RepID=UPI002414EBE8|nr:CPBP family intramembrane glutamic endopeptidase [Streptococcus pluranimalium]WFM79285.1 CPBP family intramembrane metalloprotease [Streptococcus pluranimalium]HEM6117099.1 CPBP family intramembrane metalloprotease [Streptococcus suis]HEM6117510.1 CPBP family intramembrane metalloprotease [Streptococcus suis]